MAKKASINTLNELHELVAKYYIEIISTGEEVSSGTLAAINTYLKNNDITADVVESQPLQNLQYKLKELMLEQEAEG
jgi:ABC-type Zn uptake system ZnuABC Zn-binding protein ZnuA